MINDFKVIGKLSDDLKNLIKSDKDNLLSIKNMQNDFESVKKEICILHEMEENLEILDEKISNLKSEHEKENEEIKKLESGKDWSDLNELLEKKKRIMDEISKLKSELIQNISKIERPLRKLKNMVDKGSVDIDNEKLLEKYVDSFLGKVIEDKNSEEINSILKTIQKNISEGKIETKDDEVKNILENDVFGNILKKYSALENDQKELEERIDENIGLKRRNEMEDNIKDLEKQMEISNSEIEKIKKQIDKIKGSVDEKKILLEKSIGEVENKKIRLV